MEKKEFLPSQLVTDYQAKKGLPVPQVSVGVLDASKNILPSVPIPEKPNSGVVARQSVAVVIGDDEQTQYFSAKGNFRLSGQTDSHPAPGTDPTIEEIHLGSNAGQAVNTIIIGTDVRDPNFRGGDWAKTVATALISKGYPSFQTHNLYQTADPNEQTLKAPDNFIEEAALPSVQFLKEISSHNGRITYERTIVRDGQIVSHNITTINSPESMTEVLDANEHPLAESLKKLS